MLPFLTPIVGAIAKHSQVALGIGIVAVASYAGWLKIQNLSLKADVAQIETAMAQGIADAEKSIREALQAAHAEELTRLRTERDILEGLANEFEQQKDAEKAAKWAARRALESLRSNPDVSGWLRTVPPADVQPWLRGESGGGETDPGAGAGDVPPAADPEGLVRPLRPDRIPDGWDERTAWTDESVQHGLRSAAQYAIEIDSAIH